MEQLIKKLQQSIAPCFDNKVSIHRDGFGLYRLTSNDSSIAKDLHKNDFPDVNVVKWIDDYWIKLTINLKKIAIETTFTNNKKSGITKKDYEKALFEKNLKIDKDFFETKISISLFKGDYDPFLKHQLFRAEWDNYSTSQNKHPQPHWQFYQLNEYKKELDLLTSDFESFTTEDELNQFSETLKPDFDFKKFHFAMNGNWINDENEIHSLNNEGKISKWIIGLLNHIKLQLEHLQ